MTVFDEPSGFAVFTVTFNLTGVRFGCLTLTPVGIGNKGSTILDMTFRDRHGS